MSSLNVLVFNIPEVLREISKKNTDSDITIHSRKDGDLITTFLEPSRFPEKLSSLTDCIYPADYAIVGVDEIDRSFGEALMALDLMGKTHGLMVASNEESAERARKITKGTVLEKYEIYTGSPMGVVEKLIQFKPQREERGTLVIIDHFFQVKSVGTVILGFVLSGKLSKHQKLFISGLNREVQVRSIQMHDVDVDEAHSGSRVGAALKNVDADEIQRGMFLSDNLLKQGKEISGKVIFHSALRKVPDGDFEIFVSDEMIYQRGQMVSGKMVLDRPIPLVNERLLFSNPNLSPRILGKMEIGK
ncbi:EF-Tu/IF-2/RF-3 family GTPase [Oxyplasma meridianum]|uniref:EF-Tu/IF-2/RF-3 family GTPase n=1 Tax=Oxyplasma meridianum TaxID=3073602 RepID=A0AAX4NEK2_9ARCH